MSVPASGAAQVTPRVGKYTGTETGPGDGSSITFTVTKNHKTVRNLVGNAETKTGCKAHYTGFQARPGPMKITSRGGFTASTTAYPGPKVRVTVTGRFTSATKVSGHVIVRFKTLKGCNASSPFTATRTS